MELFQTSYKFNKIGSSTLFIVMKKKFVFKKELVHLKKNFEWFKSSSIFNEIQRIYRRIDPI